MEINGNRNGNNDGKRNSGVSNNDGNNRNNGVSNNDGNNRNSGGGNNDGNRNNGGGNNNNLKVMFLGGVGEIGKNMTVLECGNDIVIIDAGLSFPNDEMPGIDLVIPDITYLKNNASKIRGLFITHGHEDHIGGIAYLLKQIKVPIYGSKLSLMLIENKLKEHRIDGAELYCVKPRAVIKAGCFSVEFVRVNHSIAGAFALAVTTPVGVVFHTGDFKIDYTPIDGEIIDLTRIAEIGKRGVMLLLCESTNIERKGYTMSEKTVGESLDKIFQDNIGRRIIVATFASNIHRVQQIIELAEKYKRKVALNGRSMLNICDAALKIGELKYEKNTLIDIDKIKNVKDENLVIISTGSQGEAMSALTRMAMDTSNKVKIGENDTIIISASPIPGNERMIYRVINNLYKKGARVIYDLLADVHVSGHACQEEVKIIHTLIQPKYFIPVHGEYRHLKQHAELAIKLGMNARNIIIPEIGSCVEVSRKFMKNLPPVPAGTLLVDGLGVGDAGSVTLRDRKHLSEDGLIVVVVGIDDTNGEVTSGPDIISRGFMITYGDDKFLNECRSVVTQSLSKFDLKEAEKSEIKNQIRKDLSGYIFKRTKQSPMVLPFMIET